MISLEAGLLRTFQFTWPPEMVGLDNANVAQAVIIMRRQDGVLLGLPVGFLPVDVLQRAATDGGEDWDFGPHFMISTQAYREDGQPVPLGLEVEVFGHRCLRRSVSRFGESFHRRGHRQLCGRSFYFPRTSSFAEEDKRVALESNSGQGRFLLCGRRVGPRDANRRGVGRGARGGSRGPRPSKGGSGKAEEGHYGDLGRAVGVRYATFASAGDSNGEPSEESGCIERPDEFSTAYRSPSAKSAAGFYVAAGVCKDDGHSAPGEVSDAFSNSRGQVAAGSEDGLNYVNPGAGGGGGPSGGFHVGPCSFGAEQGPHDVGGSTSEWRRSIVRCAIQFLRIHPRLKGIYGQTAAELANRSGAFFLQVTQNAARRMRPAAKAPVDVASAASLDFSMVNYLERFGGYGGCRELGLVQFCLAHIFDAALHSDLEGVREHLALTMVAVEQSVQDAGRWDLAYQLTLLEDPPSQMWAYKSGGNLNPRLRAFAPLCPQKWATVALAYLKEVDYIQSRRRDLRKGPPSPGAGDPPTTPSPKKRNRNPKGKGRESEEQQDK